MLLFALLACDGVASLDSDNTGSTADTGGGADSDTDSGTDSGADTGVDPVGFDVCGVHVAITAPITNEGFSNLDMPGLVTRSVRWHGEEAIAADGHSLVRRDATLAEIDRIDALAYPTHVELIGDSAFLGGASGGIAVVDLSDGTPSATAWWAPATLEGDPAVHLVGVSGARLVLRTSAGFSLVDVTDPADPLELGCGTWTGEESWLFPVSERWAAAATSAGAELFDLSGNTPAWVASVPLAEEGGAVLYGDRLLVWEEFRTVVLYDLASGAPVELTRIEDDTRVQGRAWDPAVAGGMVLHGGLDDEAFWAMDLEDDGLGLYSTSDLDPEWSCTVRVASAADGSEWDLMPMWHPESRFAPGAAELACPVATAVSDFPNGGVREPGGARVLVQSGGWRTLDLETGAEEAIYSEPSSQGFWVDEGFAFAFTDGSDWGIPLVSTLTFTDDVGGVTEVIASPGPFVAQAPLGREVWVLSEAAGREYGDPEPAATDLILWRVAGGGAAVVTPVTLPVGAAPVDVITGGDRAYVFDEADAVHIFGADGVLAATCPLADGFGDGPRVASELGAFFLDGSGRPSVVIADCSVTRLAADPVAWSFAAADEELVYVADEVGPGEGYVAVPALQALDAGTLNEVGRIPTTRTPQVVPGARLLVMDTAVIVADRPQP